MRWLSNECFLLELPWRCRFCLIFYIKYLFCCLKWSIKLITGTHSGAHFTNNFSWLFLLYKMRSFFCHKVFDKWCKNLAKLFVKFWYIFKVKIMLVRLNGNFLLGKQSLVKSTPGINFINILREAYMNIGPKSAKR